MTTNSLLIENVEDDVIYIGTEQPETCRWCGSGTDFDVLASELQLHTCLNCAKRYTVEFEGTWTD